LCKKRETYSLALGVAQRCEEETEEEYELVQDYSRFENS